MKLSIIIVNYNNDTLLRDCLKSIIINGISNQWEIIIVDNCSSDNCRLSLRKLINDLKSSCKDLNIKILENEKNLGFAAGNNTGIKQAKGDYILLLNSDTIVYPGSIEKSSEYLEKNTDVGLLTCRVELVDGSLDPACHRGFPTPWNSFCYFSGLEKIFPKSKLFSGYHLGYLDLNTTHEIDSPSGAFFLFRRELLDKIGLLDSDYFMYAEDLDWSLRAKTAGFKIIYYPFVKITHLKKRSGRKATDPELRKEMDKYFYETMKLFYRKHYQDKYSKILLYLIFWAIDLKKFISQL